MRVFRLSTKYLAVFGLAAALLFASAGCAKNVDRIQFTKWGNSFQTQRGVSMDTTTDGGGVQNGTQIPQNGINQMRKAAVGGTYHRTFATSPSFRMLGGFHTP